MQVLVDCLDDLKYGQPQTHLNLTACPLLVADSPEPGYVTLAAALAAGQVSIREVSEAGTEMRLRGQRIIAAGLIHDERIVHLAAFAAPASFQRFDDDDSGPFRSRLARWRSRRAA